MVQSSRWMIDRTRVRGERWWALSGPAHMGFDICYILSFFDFGFVVVVSCVCDFWTGVVPLVTPTLPPFLSSCLMDDCDFVSLVVVCWSFL